MSKSFEIKSKRQLFLVFFPKNSGDKNFLIFFLYERCILFGSVTIVPCLQVFVFALGLGVGHDVEVPSQRALKAHSVSSEHSNSSDFLSSWQSSLQQAPSLRLK
jgi:hypothetical protein